MAKRFLLFLFPILILVLGYFLIFGQSGSKKEIQTTSLEKVSQSASIFTKDLTTGSSPIAEVYCDADSNCSSGRPPEPEHTYLSYVILSLAARNEFGTEVYNKVKKDIFEVSTIFGLQTNWQFYLAYKDSGDQDLYNIFLDNVIGALASFSNETEVKDVFVKHRKMWLAQYVVPVAYALQSFKKDDFKDPKIQTHLADKSRFAAAFDSADLNIFQQRADNAIKWAIQSIDKNQSSGAADVFMFKTGSTLQIDTCWDFFLLSEAYLATKSLEYKKEVDSLISRISFANRSDGEYNYGILQNILPCLQALKDLRQDTSYQGIVGPHFSALSRHVLGLYDSPNRPICSGNGGFLDMPLDVAKLNRCKDVRYATVDSAWLSHIFAGNNDVYPLE